MNNYFLIIIWFLFVYLVYRLFGITKIIEYKNGITKYKISFVFAFISFLPIIIWAAGRVNFWDTENYMNNFLNLPTSLTEFIEYLNVVDKDKGFSIITYIIKLFFGNDVFYYFLIIAVVQAICLIYVYKNYSVNYLLSIFLFVVSTDYLSWMFNGIRQFTAVCLFFVCIPLILKKKYILLIFIILILSTIHKSAIILLPVIFLVQGDSWKLRNVAIMFFLISFFIFYGEASNLLEYLLQNTQYEDIISSEVWLSDNGTSTIRVLVYSIPTILSFIGRKQVREYNDPLINLSVNMSIFSTGLYIISMFTSGIYIGRLPIYFSLYNYILLPWEIEYLFHKNSKFIVYFFMFVGYLLFYFLQIHYSWGLI